MLDGIRDWWLRRGVEGVGRSDVPAWRTPERDHVKYPGGAHVVERIVEAFAAPMSWARSPGVR